MAVGDELIAFVQSALTEGHSRPQIEDALRQAGWRAEQVRAALDAFAVTDFPLPVPRPRPSLSAREAFTYLLLFTTLYIVTFNLGSLLFAFIDQALPDPALPRSGAAARSGMRFATAALVVAGPVFLYMSSRTSRAEHADPSARLSPIRRWLTYLTLFVAACVLLGDVTTAVYSLLGGELTTRFVLKVLVVGGIAGAVFWYYVGDLRVDEQEHPR